VSLGALSRPTTGTARQGGDMSPGAIEIGRQPLPIFTKPHAVGAFVCCTLISRFHSMIQSILCAHIERLLNALHNQLKNKEADTVAKSTKN
jgi:hypothetical protein